MKNITTTRFGDIDIDETKIIKFAHGIPSFENQREFLMIPYGESAPFLFLQSVGSPDLAFLMVDPFMFFSNYEFLLDDDTLEELDIKSDEDIMVFSLLTIPNGNIKQTTANLLAPIIINQVNHQAMQVILENSGYTTKHKLTEHIVKIERADEKC
ncbi:flagellar assembly protein FliW [Pectinatus haikarae]|uniref:Flagellar assembly factor FliW n=1 Tax=Pectinatus haikarae TaxID=349096 RepID=A0ABT9Y4S9_9FIRM|nr:flagellar assembly protein FliW [Pectinatus haikarae]MDQ0202834.1 flagellar assembly factor FliW [Pectinatus haikarae]